MSFRVDLTRLEKDGRGIDPRVKVRFGFLVRVGAGLSSTEIDQRLREKAQEESPGASLNDLIKKMVKEVAYGQARLSLTEFIQRFRKNKLPDLIATRFANSLFGIDADLHLLPEEDGGITPLPDEAVFLHAKEQVLENIILFLETNKLTSTETLYDFLKQQKAEWPMVDLSKLFLEEYVEIGHSGQERTTNLREKVAKKIDDSLEVIAAAAYREKFEEDKRGFVMGFMMGRVVTYDNATKQMAFNRKEFADLIGYLDSVGSALSDVEGRVFFDWLHYDSRQMAKYIRSKQIKSVSAGVKNKVMETGVLGEETLSPSDEHEKVFFEEGFDVKAFHDRYIKPALFLYHSRKIQKTVKGQVREPDLFNNLHDNVNQGRRNYTLQLRHYVQALLKLKESNYPRFMLKVRELLGLQNSPLLKNMTDQQVEQQIAYFLEQVEQKFHTVVGEALHFRVDSAVWAACSYPEEILTCRDLSHLMKWFISPSSFKEQYPKYSDTPNDQIAYMCAIWLKDFMGTMAKMSDKNFIEAEHRRDLIEKDMEDSLNLKVLQNVEVPFRVMEELDENGDVLDKPVYRVAIAPTGVEGFLNGDDHQLTKLVLSHPSMGMISWQGKMYRVFPEERKKFKKVSMNIPVMTFDEKQKRFVQGNPVYTEALIYSGDNHFVHVKDKLTRVISQDRGKEVTDENRWMLSFADPAGQEAFKAFLVARNPQGLIKLEDSEEGRFISNKTRGKNSALSTKTFKEGQEFAHVLEMSYASELPPNENPTIKQPPFQMEKVTLETQCQKFRQLLITNLSNYTVSSHDVYRSQRAWPLLFDLYFSPEFFGDKYKDFQDEGFKTE